MHSLRIGGRLITINNDYYFQDFLRVKEREMLQYESLAGSYAVIKCDSKFFFCFNTWRKQWELPAGRSEENETAKDCAIRELYEETGQIAPNLTFIGLLKSKNVINGDVKYNPVYFSEIDRLSPFQKNKETSKILLWDLQQPNSNVDPVDIHIFDYI